MEEFIVSNDELKMMFEKKEIQDTSNGWYYKDQEVEILAIHKTEPKYLLDITRAEYYKIRPKNSL
jgi:hypothetical protein